MLHQIPQGTRCFIDANIIYYSLVNTAGLTADCIGFFKRIRRGEITALASSVVVAEAMHKVMLSEAAQRYGLPRQGLAHHLQRQAHLLTGLGDHLKVPVLIRTLNIHLEPITLDLLEAAAHCSTQYQLLTNDSLTIAVMKKLSLTHLATNDDNFDSVPGITVWKPR